MYPRAANLTWLVMGQISWMKPLKPKQYEPESFLINDQRDAQFYSMCLFLFLNLNM